MKKIHFEDLCLRLNEEAAAGANDAQAGQGDPLMAGACRRYLAAEGYGGDAEPQAAPSAPLRPEDER